MKFNKKVFAGFAAGAVAVLAAGAASAAVDPAVSAALTVVETDGKAMAALVTPIVISILGLSIGIKLIKRFSNKI